MTRNGTQVPRPIGPFGSDEFLRALDLGMRGESLLDERRSGAWQPDNENRIRVRHADTGARGEIPAPWPSVLAPL